ncbi:hypothetical protein ACFYUK_28640 [Nonomuraea wenchangensis]
MRAARIVTCGEPPVVADCPDPEPGPDEPLVRVLAAPITPLDLLCASGTSYFGTPATPYVPGVQGVGTLAGDGRLVWFRRGPGWRRATAAWPSWPACRPRTWSSCPPEPTRSRWPRSGCRPWPRTRR